MSAIDRSGRVSFFGASLDIIDHQQTVAKILDSVRSRRPISHAALNVAKLVNMQTNAELRAAVNECDIVTADGQGIVWGARLFGIPIPERVTGVDLMESLFAAAEQQGLRVFLLGAKPEVVETVVRRLAMEHPNLTVAGYHHGYFWDDVESVVDQITRAKADMLFVAISSPMKEKFNNRYGERMGVPFIMGVGGSFDVYAGVVPRAPRLLQRLGMEWLFRLAQEPKRMWRRYAVTNTLFAGMLMKGLLRRDVVNATNRRHP